jgi:uncharacterized protein
VFAVSELPATTIAGIGGFAIGLIFGATAQRTNFCTMGAISDLVLMGDARRFRSWLLAIAVAMLGSQALHMAGAIDLNKSIYLTSNFGWLGAIIGGLMFGYGMTRTGGCGSRTLVRLGAGNLKSVIVFIVVGLFAYMTMRGIIAVARLQLDAIGTVDLAARRLPRQGLPDMIAALIGAPAAAARHGVVVAVAAAILAYCFADPEFRRSARDVVAGLVIGATVALGWYVTGVIAFDEFQPLPLVSLTFIAPVGDSLQYLMTFTGATIGFGVATVGGVVAGSFLMAQATGTFRAESFVDRDDLLSHMGGAALMGVGGVTALGCTIGQGITGLSTLSLGSVLAWLSILAGGVVGMKALEQGSFVGGLRATLARD